MTIYRTEFRRTERGNDPADHAGDEDYMNDFRERVDAASDPLAWTADFILTEEEAEELSDPDWIIENLVVRGHLHVYPAPANGGKTTVFFHMAGAMVKRGYSVVYVNADIAAGDAKRAFWKAKEMGVALLLPDMKAGLSMGHVVEHLEQMAANGGDYSRTVMIFDTLKKMVDVISKPQAKRLYALLRSLSAKGMTVILLAHTNKYDDANGKPVFEGTVDLRTDVDNMIYLVPKKEPGGSLVVSTAPDKVRATFEPITFRISPPPDLEVTQLAAFIDVAKLRQAAAQRERDQPIIEAITAAITAGNRKQIEIIAYCKEHFGTGKRPVQAVLPRYRNDLWTETRLFQKNAYSYELIDAERRPPGKSDN